MTPQSYLHMSSKELFMASFKCSRRLEPHVDRLRQVR